MVKRVLSALIGGPILLFLTWLGGWYLTLLIVALALLALREFLNLAQKANGAIQQKTIVLFSLLWLLFFSLKKSEWLLPLGIIFLLFILGHYAVRYPTIPFTAVWYSFLAVLYPVALFTSLYYLRELPDGEMWCFYVFLLVWLTDIGAFFIGSAFGKRKLAPNVSPNKSIEGALGGSLTAFCFGLVFWLITRVGNLPAILLLSLLTSAVSQIGDLLNPL
jgi:phosphatidate cytidylyltransferase